MTEAMTNGGFEDGLNNWVVENAQCLSTSTYHTGAKGLYMRTTGWYYPRIRQDLVTPIPVSRVITLSFWAMSYFVSAYYNHIGIYVIYTDDTETYFDYYLAENNVWEQFIILGSSLSTGKTIKQIKLQCNQFVPSGYYLFFDDVSLTLLPLGYAGGKIIIGEDEENSIESPYVLGVSIEQSCDVALRDVPLRTVGEVMDTGTYLIHTLTLTLTMRLSDADKTTLESVFISHAEATVYLEDDDGNYWTFTGWFKDKDIVYEFETNRPWKVELTFDIYTYSYSGSSVGTFTNSQLRLVGGTTLDYEDILDFTVSEETSVAIPNWVNQPPSIDTNVWNKKLKRITYTVRETEYRLYKLLQMLTTASAITFYDYIHGPTNKTAWLSSIRAGWKQMKKEDIVSSSFIDTPWEVEFEVIVQN